MLKRPVVSPYTAYILLLLKERGRSSVELAEELNLYPSQVNAYLHYYNKRGITRKSGEIWELTNNGKKYVEERYDYLSKIVNSIYGIKMNKNESKRINLYSKYRIKKIAKEWMGDGLEDCMFIVEYLTYLYFERGKTYFESTNRSLADSLAEALEEFSSSSYISPFKVGECLVRLSQKGIVYIYRGRKVRLHRVFLEKALGAASP